MNTKQVSLGITAWFLGILVPVMHHVLLHWPLADQQINNVVTRAQTLYESLPWIDWVYLFAMAIVGLILIVSGMWSKPEEI